MLFLLTITSQVCIIIIQLRSIFMAMWWYSAEEKPCSLLTHCWLCIFFISGSEFSVFRDRWNVSFFPQSRIFPVWLIFWWPVPLFLSKAGLNLSGPEQCLCCCSWIISGRLPFHHPKFFLLPTAFNKSKYKDHIWALVRWSCEAFWSLCGKPCWYAGCEEVYPL